MTLRSLPCRSPAPPVALLGLPSHSPASPGTPSLLCGQGSNQLSLSQCPPPSALVPDPGPSPRRALLSQRHPVQHPPLSLIRSPHLPPPRSLLQPSSVHSYQPRPPVPSTSTPERTVRSGLRHGCPGAPERSSGSARPMAAAIGDASGPNALSRTAGPPRGPCGLRAAYLGTSESRRLWTFWPWPCWGRRTVVRAGGCRRSPGCPGPQSLRCQRIWGCAVWGL